MLGRAAYHDCALLLDVDRLYFGEAPPLRDVFEVVEAFEPYVARKLAEGVRLADMTRHILSLMNGLPGARAFRRHLATEAVKRGAGLDVLRGALSHVQRREAA